MSAHFKEDKEKITCTGGSLDGRELWITKGLGVFVVLGRGGERETFVREPGTPLFQCSSAGQGFDPGGRRVVEMPCSQ